MCKRCVEIAEELMKRIEVLRVKPKGGKSKEDGTAEKSHVENAERDQTTSRNVLSMPRTRPMKAGAIISYEHYGAEEPNKLPGLQFRKWDSFRKALEASWNKEEIEAIASTLRDFKSEIEFRIIVSFRSALSYLASQQVQVSQQITESTRLILDGFINARDEFATQVRLQAEKLIELQRFPKGGVTKGIQELENFLRGDLGPVGMLQSPKGARELDDQYFKRSIRSPEIEEEIRILMIENAILGSLSFSTLMNRRESLELPYSHTFNWIFEESHCPKRLWSNFTEWLRHGHGIFWINGKVGSGKSTLMKYVYENEKTKVALQEWAGSMSSETSGFFLWNSGDEDQRTQRGLMKSLLFEILQRHRDMIPKVMPDVWEAWSARATGIMANRLPIDSPLLPLQPSPWTLMQLKRVFRLLLDALRKRIKFCFFIDGLDEYDGEYSDIVDIFQEYAQLPNIKICLSSRPLLVFEQAFVGNPNLRLQDLTHGDISYYATNKLYSHQHMIQLSQEKAAEVSRLVEDIVTKARGVFLWVKLVVRSLLRGLCDYNRISDLQKRVEYLPEDLEALYSHMLKGTDRCYHEQASKLFQIVRVAQKRSMDKLTLLSLSLADNEDETLADTASIRPLSSEEVSVRCQQMNARLKSICAGLLEANEPQFSFMAPNATVMFLHRTVSDWLAKKEVWDEIFSRTLGTGFSPSLSMLRSCVLQLKFLVVTPMSPLDMAIISNAMEYAKEAEKDLHTGFPKLLDQLDIAASYQWRMANGITAKHEIPSGGYDTTPSSSLAGKSCSIPAPGVRKSTNNSENAASYSEDGYGLYQQNPESESITIDWDSFEAEGFIAGGLEMDEQYRDQMDGFSYNRRSRMDIKPRRQYCMAFSTFDADTEGCDNDVFVDENSSLRDINQYSSTAALQSHDSMLRKFAELRKIRTQDSEAISGDPGLHHWSYGIEIPGIKPFGKASTFYDIARDMGLVHYIAIKSGTSTVHDQDVNQHLLLHVMSYTPGLWNADIKAPNPELVSRILQGGTDPNFSFHGITPWERALLAAASYFTSQQNTTELANQPLTGEWQRTAEAWARILEIFVRHGADPNLICRRHPDLPGHPRISPILIAEEYFPRFLFGKGIELKALLKEKGAEAVTNLGGVERNKINMNEIPVETKGHSIVERLYYWCRNFIARGYK